MSQKTLEQEQLGRDWGKMWNRHTRNFGGTASLRMATWKTVRVKELDLHLKQHACRWLLFVESLTRLRLFDVIITDTTKRLRIRYRKTVKVVYHSRKRMKILGFLLKGRGGGGYLKTLLSPSVLMEGLGMVCMYIVTWHGVTWLHSAHLHSLSDRQDCLQNNLESESKLHKFALFWVICWCRSSSSRAEKA